LLTQQGYISSKPARNSSPDSVQMCGVGAFVFSSCTKGGQPQVRLGLGRWRNQFNPGIAAWFSSIT
jgi:hypothetical protein